MKKHIVKKSSKTSKIEAEEKRILQEEQEIIAETRELKNLVKKDISIDKADEAMTAKELNFVQKFAVKNLRGHKIIFALIVATGGILVWKGVYDILERIPLFSYSFTSLFVGIAILWIFNKVTKL